MLIWAWASLLGWQTAFAQSDENLFVGSRPLALGGAFTAVADDANAMFYNVAGLQALNQHEVSFMNANLFGTGIQTTYAAYAFPISLKQTVGVDWQHIGFGDGELGYNRDILKVAFAQRLMSNLSIGSSFKFMLTNMSLDGQSVGKGSGLGLDLSFLFTPKPWFKVGVNVHDITGTKVRYNEGGSTSLLPRMVRVGVAWQPTSKLMIATDVDRKVHVGGEFQLYKALTLRMGTQKDLHTSDPLEVSFGMGLRYRAFRFDFTHSPGRRGLGQTQRYGLSASFDPASSAVRIVKVNGKDLFASYYKTYQNAEVGEILLQNKSDRSLECRLTVSVPGYEDVPYQETIIVRRGNKLQRVPLRLSLSEEVLRVAKDIAIPLEVSVEYATQTKNRSDKQSGKLVLYGRGALLWDDIGRAAAFVTSRDPSVEILARHVSHEVSNNARIRRMERNIVQAAAVFEALRKYGIRYQVDANNPYAQVVSAEWPFDNIQYPRELLNRRVGDCDDCTVLYCSTLENLGIPTAVVDAPGHIFALFDTGVAITDIYRLGLPEERLLKFKGRLWVPVETTLWNKPFEKVWAVGLEQLRSLPDWEDRIRIVSESWLAFPPADPPFEFEIDAAAVHQACDSSLVIAQTETIDDLKRTFVLNEYEQLLETTPNDSDLLFEVAYVFMNLNMTQEARSYLYRAAKLTEDIGQVESYLGNTYFIEGDLKGALRHYEKGLQIDPDDAGLKLNLERAMKKLREESAKKE